MTQKNYYKLFCDLVKKNGLSFSVLANGSIGHVYDTISVRQDCFLYASVGKKLGSKAAYEAGKASAKKEFRACLGIDDKLIWCGGGIRRKRASW